MGSTAVEEELSDEYHQVVIIGAGVAGLSAARHILRNGISDVLILEATGKAGGRIDTVRFGQKGAATDPECLVELGAQWIHGEQNEFCQLIKSSNHRHSKTSWEGKGDFLCPNGIKIENGMVDEVLGWLEDTIEEVEATFSIETLHKEKKDAEGDGSSSLGKMSMGKYLQESFHSYLTEHHPDAEEGSEEYDLRIALFQWGMSFQRIDNSCVKMNDVSLYRWSEFEVNPGEHYNNFSSGAQTFVDDILVGETLQSHILYNSSVKSIQWKDISGGANVKITTESGQVFTSEAVLITCSIGFLKSNLETLFIPALPEQQIEAIQNTGFGPVTKIFLEWAQPWWPADLKGFQLVWPKDYIDCCEGGNENVENAWYKTITGFDPVLDNPCVLLAWLGGPEAVYAETLSEDEVISKCSEVLKDFTGLDVPKPVGVAMSRWNTDRYFQGAYSFRSVAGDESHDDICAALCDPVTVVKHDGTTKPVMVLAGEALSKTHYSTLHGAYESGISQSMKLIQYFNSRSTPFKDAKGCQQPRTICDGSAEDNPNIYKSSNYTSTADHFNKLTVAKSIQVPS